MTTTASVDKYIAAQPRLTWRRQLLRGLIRTVGFNLLARVTVTGANNIPEEGPCILMMSHIGGIDPVVCIGAVNNRFVIPMTKIENTHNPLLGFFVWWWGSYTVDRNTVDRQALTSSIALLKSGQMILIAPEGTRHPEGLGEARDGLAYVAVKSNAVILPTALTGTQKPTAAWKRLRRVPVGVHFGRPFRFSTAPDARLSRDLRGQMTREAMYQLAKTQPDPSLRGIYSDVENATTDTLQFI